MKHHKKQSHGIYHESHGDAAGGWVGLGRRKGVMMTCKPMKKICVICGEEFTTTNSQKKSCSHACQDELSRRTTRKWYETHKRGNVKQGLPEKRCLYCNEPYYPNRSDQLYCSRECRKKDYTLKQKWKGRKSAAQKRKERSREKKNTGLVDIAKQARAAGLTYGQYVADQYKRGKR